MLQYNIIVLKTLIYAQFKKQINSLKLNNDTLYPNVRLNLLYLVFKKKTLAILIIFLNLCMLNYVYSYFEY